MGLLKTLFGWESDSQKGERLVLEARSRHKEAVTPPKFCAECGGRIVHAGHVKIGYESNSGEPILRRLELCEFNCKHGNSGVSHDEEKINVGYKVCVRCGHEESYWGMPGF